MSKVSKVYVYKNGRYVKQDRYQNRRSSRPRSNAPGIAPFVIIALCLVLFYMAWDNYARGLPPEASAERTIWLYADDGTCSEPYEKDGRHCRY